MSWAYAPSYWLNRLVVERAVAVIYVVAFVGSANQGRALIGRDGILPAADFIAAHLVPARPAAMIIRTLVRHPIREALDKGQTEVAMSRVSTYLNFMGQTEEAFNFYASTFGTRISGEIFRMDDMPAGPDGPQLSETEKKFVAHVELPILAGHVLMGTDMLESMGHELKVGNNVTINLEPDTRAETDRLYAALSDGGSESTGMAQMPWAYWGCTLDRYGVRWMFNCYEPAA